MAKQKFILSNLKSKHTPKIKTLKVDTMLDKDVNLETQWSGFEIQMTLTVKLSI